MSYGDYIQSFADAKNMTYEKPKVNWLGAGLGGAASGAAAGSSILPGWGTAIGAVVGAGASIVGAGMKGAEAEKEAKRQQEELEKQRKQQEKITRLQMAMQNRQNNQTGYKMFTDMVHEAIMGAR